MFALCTRIPVRQAAASFTHTHPLQHSLPGRGYSDWTGSSFPKENQIFSEKKILFLLPPSRKSVEEEVRESYVYFYKVISRLQNVVEPLDPETIEVCWKLIAKHSIMCKTEERCIEDEADSKTGKKLKDLLRTELTKIEAFSMTAEVLDDAIRGFFRPNGPLAVSRPCEQITDEELQIRLAKWDCSLSAISEASKEALEAMFENVLKELKKVIKTPSDEEIAWKAVFDARLKPLQERIIFRMGQIEGIEQKTDAALRQLVREKFRVELFLKNEIKGDLRREICQLWDVPEKPSPRDVVLSLFGVPAE